ncbi:MAG TPA: ATP-binding protein [Methylophilaceae bacterium]|jgi:signal transduction histidine kinase
MIKSFFGSMTARVFLILVGGTIVSGALVMLLASYERRDLDEQTRAQHTVERVVQIIRLLDETPDSANAAIVAIAHEYGMRVDLNPSIAVIGKVPDSIITTELRSTLGSNRNITVLQGEGTDCPSRRPDFGPGNGKGPGPGMDGPLRCEIVLAKLKDGTSVRVDVSHRNHTPPPFGGSFFKNLAIFLSALTLIAFAVAHMATKPLRKLAQAAHALSRNIEHPAIAVGEGSNEVREASMAFNSMQSSIRSYIEERTIMLAAIAHDLQTPLTRLRLRLEKVSDETLRTKLVEDLTATQDLVKEGLEFARTMSADYPTFDLVDLDSLVETLCNDASDSGQEVTLSGKIGRPLRASPHALRRCISNLLDNAIKYGKFAHISVKQEHDKAIICIIDGGAGIPPDQIEAVFRPFNRLENSRSRNSGGTGLGLTIARIIAEKHHGSIKLKNMGSKDLGLLVTLELPIS